MSVQSQANLIRRIAIFANLPSYLFELIVKAFEIRRYKAGDYILMQNTQAEGLYILAQGQAVWIQVASDGQTSQLGTMQVGYSVHDEALFKDKAISTAHLQALIATTMLVLSRKNLLSLTARNPELKSALGLGGKAKVEIEVETRPLEFKTQRDDEELLHISRRHWFSFVRWSWIPIGSTFALLIGANFIPELAAALIPFAFVIGGGIALFQYAEWANDSVIITNQRLIHHSYTILNFHEIHNEVALEHIQEANLSFPPFDIFARLFHYGDLEIKTAGRESNFKLDMIPAPENLQELILGDRPQHQLKALNQQSAAFGESETWLNSPKAVNQTMSSPKKGIRLEKEINTTSPFLPFISSFKTASGGTIYRKHWFLWLQGIFVPTLWIIGASTAIVLMLSSENLQVFGALGWALSFIALFFGIGWFYSADWDWRNDFYLINDKYIVLVNRRPFWLKNEIDQVLLANVQNVSAETSGVWQRFFSYGNVQLALIGSNQVKMLANVVQPLLVQSEISQRQQAMRRYSAQANDMSQREAIKEYMSLYQQSQENPQANQDLPYDYLSQPRPSPFGQRGLKPNSAEGQSYNETYNPAQSNKPNLPNPPAESRDTGRPPKFPRRRQS